MKKILLTMVALLLFVTSAFAGKEYTISVSQIVEHPSLDALRNGTLDRLKEKGVNVKANVHIAQGNPNTAIQIASQILGEKPDLVLAITTLNAQTVAKRIKNIPVVFTGVSDPVGAGVVKDLQNTGGKNITGMSDFSPVDRQAKLIKEIVPSIKTVGVIYNAGEPNSVVLIKAFKAEAAKLGISIEEATVANSSGVYQAAKSLIGRCQAIYVPTDNTVVSAIESAVKVCRQNRIPLFTADTDSVARGAMAAIAVDYYKMGLQSGDMAYRILVEGANPGSMPVEFLNDLNLHINKKAAASMGVTLPAAVLDRAEKIIE